MMTAEALAVLRATSRKAIDDAAKRLADALSQPDVDDEQLADLRKRDPGHALVSLTPAELKYLADSSESGGPFRDATAGLGSDIHEMYVRAVDVLSLIEGLSDANV